MSDFETWRDRLVALLDKAQEVVESGDDAAMKEMRGELRKFIADSRPNTPEIRSLDKIAHEAGGALDPALVAQFEQVLQEGIQRSGP